MKQFLVPFSNKIYDAIGAYKELKEIDWTIKAKMDIGDEIYFYCSAPVKKIVLKGIVTDIDRDFNDIIDDSKFYIKPSDCKSNNGMKYIRVKKIVELSSEISELLTFEILRENGLKGSIQGAQMLDKNKELSDYINNIV